MGTLGSVGLTTNLMPSMTLGSGGIGGSISGDNITTTHLMNIKRVAYEVRTPPTEALIGAAAPAVSSGGNGSGPSQADVEAIVRAVIEEVLGRKGSY
jgi:acetaldehyde dehydrogenase (acetylating)